MKKGLLRIIAAGAVMAFGVMTSTVTAKCTEDGWYTGNETDMFLEDFYKDMAEQGIKFKGHEDYVDPKIAHPTESSKESQQKPLKSCDHVYESKVTKEPTCAEEGEMTYTCTLCGKYYKETIAATGEHSYSSEVTKNATCKEEGIVTYICGVCGDSYEDVIPLTDHEYVSKVTEKAQCTSDGVMTYTCSICGDTYTEDIPATGHGNLETFIDEPAGLFTKGRQITRCAVCGEVIETMDIPSKATDVFSKVGNFFKNLFA